MNFGLASHSKLKVLNKTKRLRIPTKSRAEIETETSVNSDKLPRKIVLFWLAWIFIDDDKTHSIVCGFQTTVEVINEKEDKEDLNKVLSLVAESCEEFTDRLNKFAISEPLLAIKFQSLAARILESLILID